MFAILYLFLLHSLPARNPIAQHVRQSVLGELNQIGLAGANFLVVGPPHSGKSSTIGALIGVPAHLVNDPQVGAAMRLPAFSLACLLVRFFFSHLSK